MVDQRFGLHTTRGGVMEAFASMDLEVRELCGIPFGLSCE
jgi:hypothetical protein